MCSGTLSDNIVYYVNGGVRYPFLDEATYFAWGFTWSLLNTVNCGISGFLPMGEAMPRPSKKDLRLCTCGDSLLHDLQLSICRHHT